jgi:hypothetical protein
MKLFILIASCLLFFSGEIFSQEMSPVLNKQTAKGLLVKQAEDWQLVKTNNFLGKKQIPNAILFADSSQIVIRNDSLCAKKIVKGQVLIPGKK